MTTRQLNIRIGTNVFEQLDIISNYFGVTRSELVRQAIIEFVIDFDKKKNKLVVR